MRSLLERRSKKIQTTGNYSFTEVLSSGIRNLSDSFRSHRNLTRYKLQREDFLSAHSCRCFRLHAFPTLSLKHLASSCASTGSVDHNKEHNPIREAAKMPSTAWACVTASGLRAASHVRGAENLKTNADPECGKQTGDGLSRLLHNGQKLSGWFRTVGQSKLWDIMEGMERLFLTEDEWQWSEEQQWEVYRLFIYRHLYILSFLNIGKNLLYCWFLTMWCIL